MSSMKQIRVGLSLEPLDTLFFRDGRPFEAATQGASGLPQPQTVAGALRTWLLRAGGCDFEKLGRAIESGKSFAEAASEGRPGEASGVEQVRFRGPWFAVGGEPVVHLPCILHQVEDTSEHQAEDTNEIVRLAPLRRANLPGWIAPEEGMLPLWVRETRRTKRLDGYLRREAIAPRFAVRAPMERGLKRISWTAEAKTSHDVAVRAPMERGLKPGSLIPSVSLLSQSQ